MTVRFTALLGLSFASVSGLTIAAATVPSPARPPMEHLTERWNPNLADVHTLSAAVPIVDRYIAQERGSRQERIAAGVDDFVRERFAHGVPHLTIKENWLSRLGGLFWANLGMPVTPESILNHRHAMCSQQAIVLQALLYHYGIRYASVLFSWPNPIPENRGHFATVARVDGAWRYYDPDLEADRRDVNISQVLDGSSISSLYPNKQYIINPLTYAATHRTIRIAHINQNPAPNGALFERTARWLSHWGWSVLGLLWFIATIWAKRLRTG